jgi:hypothetical protein
MYRELLRQAMLDNRGRPADKQLPQPLLLDMVRMSALLHSAADCKTGFVIVCPADLMQQLRSQQSRVTQGLKMLQMMHREGPGMGAAWQQFAATVWQIFSESAFWVIASLVVGGSAAAGSSRSPSACIAPVCESDR